MSITHSRTTGIGLGILAAASIAAVAATSARAASSDHGARRASATIIDVAGNDIGFAKLVEDAAGAVHVNVKVSGLPAGLHGLHIHGIGACSPNFSAAGSHFNPLNAPHGSPHGDAHTSHAGDLPNMTVNRSGQGRLNAVTTGLTLTSGNRSVFDVDGSALVIHALPDDFATQPTGGSGDRIACGVVSPS